MGEKALAKMFRIRQQRVLAIIALKQMEADAEASGFLKAGEEDELQILMEEEVYDCIESQGTGERNIVTTASFPEQGVSPPPPFPSSPWQAGRLPLHACRFKGGV